MNAVKFPDGKVVNLDIVQEMEVSGSDVDVTFHNATTYTFTAQSATDAEQLLSQLMNAAAVPGQVQVLTQLPVTRVISSVTPNTTDDAANDSLTIAGTNMIDQSMIDAGQCKVTINGLSCGIVSAIPSSIVVINATQVTLGVATINVIQSIYDVGDTTLCTNNTLLTIT